jgi:small subunit ribosomal protein S2
MKPYIYGKRNAIHIHDIRETLRGLLSAQRFITRVVAGGADILFVGTKRQARDAIQEQTARCGMHYVTERWLGGTLTNFRTIRLRLKRLEELEALVSSPEWETNYSKKMQSTMSRELHKIQRNLNGVRNMSRLPGALVVVDVRKEINAVKEAQSLGIPTICLIDTDSDPDFASIPIPGNDDSMRSIQLIVTKIADAIEEGKRARPEPSDKSDRDKGGMGDSPRRRGGRRGSAPYAGATAGAAMTESASPEPVNVPPGVENAPPLSDPANPTTGV